MPFMPMMPGSGQMGASPQAPGATPPPAAPSLGGMDLLSLLGASPSQPNADPSTLSAITSNALKQFDQIQQMIMDLTSAFPGNEDAARQMMDGLERWRQAIVVSMSPTSAQMPGAGMML